MYDRQNEEDVLARCMESVNGVFDQIVIVDTGATDRTREIASRYADLVADYVSLSECDYVRWLDADDGLLDRDRKKLKRLFES